MMLSVDDPLVTPGVGVSRCGGGNASATTDIVMIGSTVGD